MSIMYDAICNEFKNGWASGTMKCHKCGKLFENVRFRYYYYDKVEGEWPKCCGVLAGFCTDWKPELNGRITIFWQP